MSVLQINLDECPDQVSNIPAGLHILEITGAEVSPSKKSENLSPGDPKYSENLKLTFKVKDDASPSNGKGTVDYCNISDNEFSKVRLKKIFKAAGVMPKGTVTIAQVAADLVGRIVQVRIVHENYTDPQTQVTTERAKIADYLVPTK